MRISEVALRRAHEIVDGTPIYSKDIVVAEELIKADAENKRLQSQPITFDDIPWEPVTSEGLEKSLDGIYQIKDVDECIDIWVKYGIWRSASGAELASLQLSKREYKEFRKLPIALYTPTPEPAKRYEIKPIESGMFRSYKITERNGDTFMANMTREKAQELCDKLNRLEELEAKDAE